MRITPKSGNLFFQTRRKFAGLVLIKLNREDNLGIARSQFLSARWGPCLNDDRAPLWRAGKIERPLNGKIFTLMIQNMHFTAIIILASFLVENTGSVFPTVPEALYHFNKFSGNLITMFMLDHFLAPEVHRGFIRGGRHNIPPCTSTTEMIKWRELPGNIERFGKCGGGCPHKTDFTGHTRKRGQKRCRFKTQHLARMTVK